LLSLEGCLALSQLRLGAYLVQHRRPPDGLLPGAVSLQLGVSFGAFALGQIALITLLPALAADDLLKPMRWMLVAVLIAPLSGILRAPLDREQRYAQATLPAVVALPVQAAVSLTLALGGQGVIALVLGYLAREAVQLAVLAALVGSRLRWAEGDFPRREALRFGLPLLGTAALVFFYWNVDDALVGALLGSESLGHYYVAFRFPHLLMALTAPLIGVALSVFSRLRTRDEALGRAFETCTRFTGYLCFVGGAVGICLAERLTEVYLGRNWLPAARPMQILFALAALRGPLGFWTALYESRGITRHHYRLPALSCALMALAGPAGVLWLGLSGAAAAVVVAMLPGLLILVPRYVRQILPTVSVLGCLRLPALLALGNAALLIALGRLTPPLGVSGLSVLLALIAIGNAACVVALERRPLVGLVSELRRRA
jgi:O-antigen/teichoic acid export membrane protein